MSAVILDGKKVASEIKNELAARVTKLAKRPGLGTVLVGLLAGAFLGSALLQP